MPLTLQKEDKFHSNLVKIEKINYGWIDWSKDIVETRPVSEQV